MSDIHPRMKRENKTIEAMVHIYCKGRHNSKIKLCAECEEFLKYAQNRLSKCQFQEKKPACVRCTIHCYKLNMREKARLVMRYAGPRMLYHHPILTIFHFIYARGKQTH